MLNDRTPPAPYVSRRDLILGALAAAACLPVGEAEAATIRSFAANARRKGILFGSAIEEWSMVSNERYMGLIKQHCAVLTPEVSMKWDAIESRQGEPDYRTADRVLAVAKAAGKRVRGHTLAWHRSVPGWATTCPDFREAVHAHMERTMDRYRGTVDCWDVLNEAIEVADGRADGLRRSIYLNKLGPGYIDWLYRSAHAIDPTARLVYNDYGCEGHNEWHLPRRRALLRLVRGMLDRGVPIHAVGFQAHLLTRMPFSATSWKAYLAEFRKLGLDVLITELDVDDRRSPADVRDREVANLYRVFLDATLAEPAVKAVILWGITDAVTWLRNPDFPEYRRSDGRLQRPLPYNDRYAPKRAAYAIQGALDRAPVRAALS